ncbi:hypothetical protein HY732_00290 [Candidatus Uhrbacteria bacterium]|nr:hypothetical protein [Candidatus Uhrbacteria bacterium]
MRIRNIQKERGSALLISIIVASSLLIVGVEVSMFVVSSIRQARSIDQTLVASYAAESGVESALHQIRKEGRTVLRTDTQDTADNYYKDDTTHVADNRNARWTFKKGDIVDAEKFTTTVDILTKSFLAEQEAIDINLYTTNDDGFVIATDRMKDMAFSWKSHTCATAGDMPWIETTAVSWPLVNRIVQWDAAITRKNFQQAAQGAQSVVVPLSQLIPPGQTVGASGMTLRIKPFFCSLREVMISFPDKDDPAVRVSIPNYARIAPLGTFGSSGKTITVFSPLKGGTSGIFDFALFGEETIEKKEEY